MGPIAPTEGIAYVYPARYHFVDKDIKALRMHAEVHEHRFNSGPTWMLPWDMLRQSLFLLRCRRQGVRQVIAHFAGYHTVLPTLLGFRTHIVIAGSDACSFPGIAYGSFRKHWMRRAMSFSMRRARTLLPVHASLERFDNRYSDLGPIAQGYAHFVPGHIAPTVAIPYGFDQELWRPSGPDADPRAVLCVASGTAPGNAVHFRKGVDLLITAALELPSHQFTIVGATDPSRYKGLPSNLRILGQCPPARIRELLATHAIYAQPSVMEGFPNALCEAMLTGCIPVVSSMTSMPDIVGDCGAVLQQRDVQALVAVLKRLDELPIVVREEQRKSVRDRVIGFTEERRTKALLEVLGEARRELDP